MKLIDHEVIHKAFGKGMIIELQHDKIMVEFESGVKVLTYPDVFIEFMTLQDPIMDEAIRNILKSRADDMKRLEDEKKDAWEEHIAKMQVIPVKTKKKASKPKAIKPVNRANIAFKCNMIDVDQLDFSDVFKWVGSDEREMSIKWKAMTSLETSEENKNKALKLKRVQENSLCVLTMKEPHQKEKERFIFGVFLVGETQESDCIEASFVNSKNEYKMALTSEEAHQMKFWKYHSNANKPDIPSWSSGIHRYFLDDQAVQILKDISEIKRDAKDTTIAEKFLSHFIEVNAVDIDKIGLPSGALVKAV
ncbi:hypothetical protein [Fusibacter bizertensis]